MQSRPLVAWSAALVLAAVSTWSGAVRAAVIWKADFETGDLTQWNGTTNGSKGARKNIEFVADPVQQGKTAAKFTIHPDDTFGGGQQRVQVTRNQARTGEGQDTFMSWYVLVPADPLIRDNIAYWESNSSYQNMMTWWVAPKGAAGGGTTINYGTGALGRNKQWTADITLNKWHQLAVHIHWSVNAQMGSVQLYFDGAMVVDVKVQTKADGNSLFFQAGYHRASVSPLIDSIYIDNFVEADNLAEILAPPTGETGDGGVVADSGTSSAPPDGGMAGATGAGGSAGTGGSGGGTGITGGGAAAGSSDGTGGNGVGAPGQAPGTGRGPVVGEGSFGCALGGATTPGLETIVFLAGAMVLPLGRRRPRVSAGRRSA
jgi:hypothetical protein